LRIAIIVGVGMALFAPLLDQSPFTIGAIAAAGAFCLMAVPS
jgi:hypothetical protein